MVALDSGAPVGLLGAQSQTTPLSGRRRRTAGTSMAKPSSGPRRGTGSGRASRCEASTAYMP